MAPKTIILKGAPMIKEAVSTGIITPGMLILLTSVHATADGNAAKRFALENEGIGRGILDDYASGDTFRYGVFKTGEEVYALLEDSNTIVAGDPLASAGDGTLKKHVPQAVDEALTNTYDILVDAIVGYALEAVTTSGAVLPIRVEVA